MKIMMVASEVFPFASTGGLSDVMGSLPKALVRTAQKQNEELDVRVFTPLYSSTPEKLRNRMNYITNIRVDLSWRNLYCGIFELKEDGVTYYFIDNEYYFKRFSLYGSYDDGERFAFFSKAVLSVLPCLNFYPDILHANDWHTALSIIYLKMNFGEREEYRRIKTVFTIHNIVYQGVYGFDILEDVFGIDKRNHDALCFNNDINLMKGAIVCADRVTTVSETYANEIKTPRFGYGLHRIISEQSYKLSGIMNGIDSELYNPRNDNEISFNYSLSTLKKKSENKTELQKELGLTVDPGIPMFIMVSRLDATKGLDIVLGLMDRLMQENIQFVVLGKGNSRYENIFREFGARYHGKMRVCIDFNKTFAKKLYSSADILLMPSVTEPCGLSQMIACAYGTVPIVRETGGLYDSIQPYYEDDAGEHGNGFTFSGYSSESMYAVIQLALSLYKSKTRWNNLQKRAMKSDFSWDKSANLYLNLYHDLIN